MQFRIKTAAASVVGSSHEDRNQPCQDYALGSRGRYVSAIALADGAGSAANSAIGAKLVVSDVLKLLRTDFDQLLELDDLDKDEEVVASEIAEKILGRLRRSLTRCAERENIPFGSLASTLQFAATDGTHYLCGQLGDGRIALFNRDLTTAESPFEARKGEFFNQTVFVTSDSAYVDLDLEWGSMSDIGGFALMSDGSEESLFNRVESRFAPALNRMIGWLDVYSERKVREALAANLGKTLKDKTGDDLSLALMRVLRV